MDSIKKETFMIEPFGKENHYIENLYVAVCRIKKLKANQFKIHQ